MSRGGVQGSPGFQSGVLKGPVWPQQGWQAGAGQTVLAEGLGGCLSPGRLGHCVGGLYSIVLAMETEWVGTGTEKN